MKALLTLTVLVAGCAPARIAPTAIRRAIDYHEHLVSPAFEPIVKLPARDGGALVRELDRAGIDRAVVLSVGYSFADQAAFRQRGQPAAGLRTEESVKVL